MQDNVSIRIHRFRSAACGLALMAAICSILIAAGDVHAQPANEDDPNCLPPPNRLRVWGGVGNARIQPGILSEGEPSWFFNSAIEANENSLSQMAVPIIPAKPIQVLTLHGGIDWTYKDRLQIGWRYYSVDQEFDRDDTTRTTYFAPATKNFRWALFEGIRLQRYVEDRRTAHITYLHPLRLPGLKGGPFIESENYIEINDISLGSFQATRADTPLKPFTSTWSEAGLIPGEYRMFGTHPGLALELQLFQFLGATYRAAYVNRQGTFKMHGTQFFTEDLNGGETYQDAIFPFFYGELSDVGSRHNLELVFTFLCRYGLHFGFLYENFERSYDIYLAENFRDQGRLINKKNPNILGISELFLGPHKIEKAEVYLKFSAALFW